MASRTSENNENQCPFHAERSGEVREVGSHAVWSLSSCKPGKIYFLHELTIYNQIYLFINYFRFWC